MKKLFLCLLCACALNTIVSAHVLDQYLQVAQVTLAPDGVRVELRLIPGIKVADQIFALIDADGDGQISRAEEQIYARRVMQDVALQIDEKDAPLALTAIEFPSRGEMNEGVGAIRLNLKAEPELNAAGEHRIVFRNDHLPELGVYLANALIPSTDAIEITGQQRDRLQHEYQVDFLVLPTEMPRFSQYASVFLFFLCLVLFLTQRKRLNSFFRSGRINQCE